MTAISQIRLSAWALAAGLILMSNAAQAETTSFFLPLSDVVRNGGATLENGSIGLAAAGTSSLAVSFGLPRDYEDNTRVTINMHLLSNAACTVHLVGEGVRLRRVARNERNGVVTPANGTETVSLASKIFTARTFFLDKPAGSYGQKRGDAFFLNVQRDSAHADDNCDKVFLTAIEVVYTRP